MLNPHVGYASRIYRRDGGPGRDWRCVYVQAAPPDQPRTGIAFPIEGSCWIVTVAGGGGDYAPTTESEFLEFARSLPTGEIYSLIRNSTPLTGITGYRRTENRWRHFEKLRRLPRGLLAAGDSVCAFNPVYGQGMTIAAMEADMLDSLLASRRAGFERRYYRGIARFIQTAWTLATGEDARYHNVDGRTGTGVMERFMHRYLDRIMAVTTYDAEVRRSLLRVFTMVAQPAALFHPRVLWRIAAHRWRLPDLRSRKLRLPSPGHSRVPAAQ
jgi:hypothetical protein